jgi:ADP-ribosyl-[dinitrogen reductase] hydrolase
MPTTRNFLSLCEYPDLDAELGGLVGLLVGDAMGVPWEFQRPEQLPPRHLIEMSPPTGYRRSHANVLCGTWSDDGAQALCLLISLLECGKLSLADLSSKLLRWLDDGYMAVDDDVFDVGIQTSQALDRLRKGQLPETTGGATERENGNGSLMRVLPLTLWHAGSDYALVADAHLQSLPTHAHPRSMVACAFYCLVARGYLQKLDDPWSWADHKLEEVYRTWSDLRDKDTFLAELGVLRDFPNNQKPHGSGYVIDTLWSARRALEEPSFEDVVRTAIGCGNDTDTTAAVAGGLAGIRFGIAEIPKRWLIQLRGIHLVEPMITEFHLIVKIARMDQAYIRRT